MSNNNDILQVILGRNDFETSIGKKYLLSNFYEVDFKFREWEEDFLGSDLHDKICRSHDYIKSIYASSILEIVYHFAYQCFNESSIDFVLMNYQEEVINMKFLEFTNNKGFNKELKNELWLTIMELANELNKRFCFDEVSLVSLIEASMGKNIIEETGRENRSNNQVLSYKDGLYTLAESDSKKISTLYGNAILEPNGMDLCQVFRHIFWKDIISVFKFIPISF